MKPIDDIRATVAALRSQARPNEDTYLSEFDHQADGIERALVALAPELERLAEAYAAAAVFGVSVAAPYARAVMERDDARLEAENLRVERASVRTTLGAADGEPTVDAAARAARALALERIGERAEAAAAEGRRLVEERLRADPKP